MLRVVKVRLYPNNAQTQSLMQHFGSARFVYNAMLRKSIDAREANEKVSIYELKKLLPVMKDTKEFSWMKDIDSTALQNAVINLDKAYKHFFRRVRNGDNPGFPRWKTRHDPRQSYQSSTAKIKNGKLYLPKIGSVKAVFHRGEIAGILKTVTVSGEAGQFYAAINYEDGKEQVIGRNNGKFIGIDVGVNVFAYMSNGKAIRHVDVRKEIADVVKVQKVLSRRKKGGVNRAKAKAELAKKHLKLRNKRNDFLHKVTKRLSDNQTIAVENLKIKNMSKSAKGTVDNPNMRSSAKSGLNRSIMEQAWGRFFDLLEYKLERNGGRLIRVDPKHTSQTCSCCGHISKENRLTQAKFVCTVCGNALNADHNASINILAAGIVVKAS